MKKLNIIMNEKIYEDKYFFYSENIDCKSIIEGLNKKFELIFGDNGCGSRNKSDGSFSIGLELVNLLAMQLNGNLIRLERPGTFYKINFEEVNN